MRVSLKCTGIFLYSFFFLCLLYSEAFSDSFFGGGNSVVPYDKFTIGIVSENDVYIEPSFDKYYTAGNRLTFTSREMNFADQDESNHTYLVYIGKIGFANWPRVTKFNIGISQEIYTPKEKTAIVDIKDRPYAGYLYLSFGLTNRNSDLEERLWLDLGVVGPASLAEQTQDFIHLSVLKHESSWPGWDSQLSNELALNIHYQLTRKYCIHDSGYISSDMLLTGETSVGNVDTHVGASTRFRIGKNLDVDFGVSKINMSGDASTVYSNEFSLYVFAGAGGRVVGRNMFLSGNTYGTSTGLDVIPFVYNFELGISMVYEGFRISYVFTHRSREFTNQDASTNTGSIMLNFAF